MGYYIRGRMGGARRAFLKHKLRETEVTYAELAKRLKKHGFKGNRGLDYQQAETGHVPGHVLSGMSCGPGIGRRGAEEI